MYYMPKRKLTSVEVPEDLMRKIDDFLRRYGGRGIKKQAISRLMAWFAMQPTPIKQLIMGWQADEFAAAYVAYLKSLIEQVLSLPKASVRDIRSQAGAKPAQLQQSLPGGER